MERLTRIIIILSLLVLIGCGRSGEPAGPAAPPGSDAGSVVTEEEIVIANCCAVQAASERFAAGNGGIYSADVNADTTIAGHTLLVLLADEPPLENPYTGEPLLPVNGRGTGPGTIGYEPVRHDDLIVGYIITGWGDTSVVAELSNAGSPDEAQVRLNCMTVRAAVESYYTERGEYPGDDYSLWGNAARVVYRACGYLENPYTGGRCLPVYGTATAPGEIGYAAIPREGAYADYILTGYGATSVIAVLTSLDCTREEALVASDCRSIQWALEAFAADNSSLYPCDLTTDRNRSGRSVRDLLPGGEWPVSPYTGLRAEPVAGRAAGPGEIGYEVFERGGWEVGYVVSGFGERATVVELSNIEEPGEAQVRANCLQLRESVEEFAALCGGAYPDDVDRHRTPDGRTVLDLLARGHPLQNPYTGMQMVLANYTAAFPGEAGYARITFYEWDRDTGDYYIDRTGYVITGCGGRSMEVVLNNLGFDPVEAHVLSNCRTVQLAAEEWARLGDYVYIYPSDVDCDVAPSGETLVDLLPGGRHLMNPYTKAQTEPVNACAANPGEVGYVPNVHGGRNVGYTITGNGRAAGVLIHTIWHCVGSTPTRDTR